MLELGNLQISRELVVITPLKGNPAFSYTAETKRPYQESVGPSVFSEVTLPMGRDVVFSSG